MAIPNSHPLTPINPFGEHNLPTVPICCHHAQPYLSTPLLSCESTSNLLNHNNFHVIPERSHTFPAHFPEPQFNQAPAQQFYSQQPYDPRYFAQQLPPPQYYYHPYPHTHALNPAPPLSSIVHMALPDTSHIPILSGRSDFNAWNNGVQSLIVYLGYAGHIVNPPTPGVAPRPDRTPSYPPILLPVPSTNELATS